MSQFISELSPEEQEKLRQPVKRPSKGWRNKYYLRGLKEWCEKREYDLHVEVPIHSYGNVGVNIRKKVTYWVTDIPEGYSGEMIPDEWLELVVEMKTLNADRDTGFFQIVVIADNVEAPDAFPDISDEHYDKFAEEIVSTLSGKIKVLQKELDCLKDAESKVISLLDAQKRCFTDLSPAEKERWFYRNEKNGAMYSKSAIEQVLGRIRKQYDFYRPAEGANELIRILEEELDSK